MATPGSTDPTVTGGNLLREHYDAETDTLFFRLNEALTTAKHLDEEMWLLIDPTTGRVVGLMVEDFKRIFLKRHPDLEVAYANAHPPRMRRVSQSVADAFVRVFMGWLSQVDREAGLALSPS
jgi:uncharacterized protein YuzE